MSVAVKSAFEITDLVASRARGKTTFQAPTAVKNVAGSFAQTCQRAGDGGCGDQTQNDGRAEAEEKYLEDIEPHCVQRLQYAAGGL
jgi:hypothetical protein